MVLVTAAAALACAAVAQADQTTHDRVKVDGFAEAIFGCPGFFSPAGTICRETHIQVFRESSVSGGGAIGPSHWMVSVEQYTLEFVSDDPNVPPIGPIDDATCIVDNPAVTFDDTHLDFASLVAAVPLSDGTTADLRVDWLPTAAREVHGNDGPFLAGSGSMRHFNDGCVTANTNAHQKLRFGVATGTLNGAPFTSYSDFAFAGWLGTAQFLFITNHHGGCS
jgi:hypothetical protein